MTTETTILCGADSNLVATLTLPAGDTGARGLPVALLTNSGVISRTGPHRINVQLARRLAERGIASVRFDLSGIGDSRRAPGSTLSQMEQWVLDSKAVMDVAERRLKCQQFFMVGFCSGAEVAYRTALVDKRLTGVVLWDLYAYPTLRSRWNTLLFKLQRAGLGGIARKLADRARALLGGTPPAEPAKLQLQDLEPPRIPSRQEFASDLEKLMNRGVAVFVMFCGGEPQWYNYPKQLHDSLSAFPVARTVRCEQLFQSDHVLTLPGSRTAFIHRIDSWLDQDVLSKLASPVAT